MLIAVYVVALCTLVAAIGQSASVQGHEGEHVQDKTIEAVLAEYTPSLMSLPGVVGTAEGECEGQPCIKVLVAESRPDLVEQIPSSLHGYPVVVEETGPFQVIDLP